MQLIKVHCLLVLLVNAHADVIHQSDTDDDAVLNRTDGRRMWALSGLSRLLFRFGTAVDRVSPFVDLTLSAIEYDDPSTQWACGDDCQWYGKTCRNTTATTAECKTIDRPPWYGQHCADANGHCKCYGKVLYGYFGRAWMASLLQEVVAARGFRVVQNVEGGIDCTTEAVGTDPSPGLRKSCRCMMEWDRIPAAGVAVSLKSVHRNGYCANEIDKVVCNRGHVDAWERFKLIPNMDRSGFYLESQRNNKKCLTHSSVANRRLMCPERYPGHGGVTQFDSLILTHYVPEDEYSLRRWGSHRGYCADHCDKFMWWCTNAEMRCDRESANEGSNSWEKFRLTLLDNSRRLGSTPSSVFV